MTEKAAFPELTERWPSGRRRTPAKGVRVKSPSRVRIPLSPPDQSLVLPSDTSASPSYGNLRSADNFRGKHDATIASTGNGRRCPWAPIRTIRSRRRERVTKQPHAYSPQTWTCPCRDELCDSARRVRRDSRCTKRGTPATGQPVRECESRPLRRINRNAAARFVPVADCRERQLSCLTMKVVQPVILVGSEVES